MPEASPSRNPTENKLSPDAWYSLTWDFCTDHMKGAWCALAEVSPASALWDWVELEAWEQNKLRPVIHQFLCIRDDSNKTYLARIADRKSANPRNLAKRIGA